MLAVNRMQVRPAVVNRVSANSRRGSPAAPRRLTPFWLVLLRAFASGAA